MRRVYKDLSNAVGNIFFCRGVVIFFAGVVTFSLNSYACHAPVYLTFDTGHMGVAEFVHNTLRQHQVRATFFLANERTQDGGSSLDERWAPWWRDIAKEGHAFGSHTWDHWVHQADISSDRWRVRPSQGAQAGQRFEVSATQYCEQLQRPAQWFKALTGQPMLPLFRAPAGRVTPALLKIARLCGFEHVGWAPAGFLGDELPSDRYPNAALLDRALRSVKAGDILMAHLGIWSRQEAWAPAVLEPLIVGLKARGMCFRTLRDHPSYHAWIRQQFSAHD